MVVRFQSSMGRSLKRVDSDDLNVKGLVLATVSKINYQYQSVEVKVNNLTLGRHIGDDGSLAVPYPKSFIGRTPEGSVFGTKPLITEGSVVLIGFLNDDINSPIILNVYGDNEQNKMINTNPLEGGKFDTDDIYKYSSAIYEILPSLNYKYNDGEGTSIKTFNGKSFFSMTSGEEEKPQATDFYTGTEYQDLFTSYYGNKTLIEPRIQKAPNMLFKHQGVFYDDGTPDNHITTLFISERGDIRASVLNTETQKRTTQEMSSDGSYRVIKQDDDLMLDEAQVWIEYGISEDNKFYIKNDKHKFEFTDEGIYIDDKPMLENLDESIAEAMKNLNEIQKELDDINYLLEGVGKDNLEELIESTKESIEASNKATSDVNRLTAQISEVSGRTEGIITQFQEFRDTTFKDFYDDVSPVINEVNQNFPSMKTDVNNLKTKVNNLEKTEIPNIKTRITELENNNNNNADKIISDRGEHIGAMIQLEQNYVLPSNKYVSIPWSKVTYNNAEFWDSNNPTRLVVPKGITKVRVAGNVLWDSNATGQRMLRILKNGTYSLGLPYTRDVAISTAPQNGTSGVIPVKEGDYFEFEAFQDSGEDRQFRADPYTWFSIEAIELETETMEKDFMLIGHRGSTGYTDEHTIKGYQMALDKGADYIEMDLQLTKDNKLLCMHDSTIDRTTTGTGKVADMTLSYIQTNFTSLNGEPIPSLDDVLNHFGTEVKYYIETKRPFDANMDKELLTQLKAKGLIGIGSEKFQVIIQSFARESLINIHNQFSNIPLAYLTSTFSEAEMDDCLSYGSYAIAPKYTTITKELVDLAHSKGLKVHAWTVNTTDEMQSLIQMGVDGFFTNYLDEYKKI